MAPYTLQASRPRHWPLRVVPIWGTAEGAIGRGPCALQASHPRHLSLRVAPLGHRRNCLWAWPIHSPGFSSSALATQGCTLGVTAEGAIGRRPKRSPGFAPWALATQDCLHGGVAEGCIGRGPIHTESLWGHAQSHLLRLLYGSNPEWPVPRMRSLESVWGRAQYTPLRCPPGGHPG